MTNPFCSTALLNLPLDLSLCQQIHATALWHLARGERTEHAPRSLSVNRLRAQMHRFGPETCLVHPDTIEQLFTGVTLAVYQQIEDLYCSRLARSRSMVTRIIARMAHKAHQPPLREEAIWAICVYLEERRMQENRLATRVLPDTWWIGVLAEGEEERGAAASDHLLVGVLDLSHQRVLAFRVGAASARCDLCSLVFADALMALRQPSAQATNGLIWQVPGVLLTPETPPLAWTGVLASFGMQITSEDKQEPFIEEIRQVWRDQRTRRNEPGVRWSMLFDSVLHKVYGSSPLRVQDQANYDYAHLTGYGRDPISLVPALRALLPMHEGRVSESGEILFDDLHYTDELLTYFPGTSVTVQRSEETEAVIWVSLNGEILTQAVARELVRRDGSYRHSRVKGGS